MTMQWHNPLDPECPDVVEWEKGLDDPIMRLSGCAGEFNADFEKRHRSDCDRCQLYGAENIEITDGGF